MHTPKVGDRFNLLGMEWEVYKNTGDFIEARTKEADNLVIPLPTALRLDWIKPEVKFSEEQKAAIKEWVRAEKSNFVLMTDFFAWLDAHTQK